MTLTFIETLWQHSAIETSSLLLVALLLAYFTPLPHAYQPWQIVQFIARALAAKVNKPQNSNTQQQLSGILATLLLLLPLLAIVILMRQLSDWPAAFDAVLLYLCLDSRRYELQVQQVQQYAEQGQLRLAKEQLQSVMLRDCQQLSALGLAKAAIEGVIQRQSRHHLTVLCWFLVSGGTSAFAYRLLLALHQAWPERLSPFQWFGRTLSTLIKWLTIPGDIIVGTLLAIRVDIGRARHYYVETNAGDIKKAQRWLLAGWASALQCNLAGPLMYQSIKVRRSRLGAKRAPDFADVRQALRISQRLQSTVFVLLLFCMLLLMLYHWPHG